MVQNVHLSGGSLLGVSRGGPSVSEMVDSLEVIIWKASFEKIGNSEPSWFLEGFMIYVFACWYQERGINMLFVLGGNGTHAGADAIHNEVGKLEDLYWPGAPCHMRDLVFIN